MRKELFILLFSVMMTLPSVAGNEDMRMFSNGTRWNYRGASLLSWWNNEGLPVLLDIFEVRDDNTVGEDDWHRLVFYSTPYDVPLYDISCDVASNQTAGSLQLQTIDINIREQGPAVYYNMPIDTISTVRLENVPLNRNSYVDLLLLNDYGYSYRFIPVPVPSQNQQRAQTKEIRRVPVGVGLSHGDKTYFWKNTSNHK